MTPFDSAAEFADFATRRGFALETATPAQGFDAMIAFFQEVGPASQIVEGEGDMLLYQWGVHDWGEGPSFQFNITRQFIEIEEDEEQVMSPLGITFHFPPSDEAKAFGVQNQWCESIDGVAELIDFISQSAPYAALKDSRADRVEVSWSPV